MSRATPMQVYSVGTLCAKLTASIRCEEGSFFVSPVASWWFRFVLVVELVRRVLCTVSFLRTVTKSEGVEKYETVESSFQVSGEEAAPQSAMSIYFLFCVVTRVRPTMLVTLAIFLHYDSCQGQDVARAFLSKAWATWSLKEEPKKSTAGSSKDVHIKAP